MISSKLLNRILEGVLITAFGVAISIPPLKKGLFYDHPERAGEIQNSDNDEVNVFARSQALLPDQNVEYPGYLRFSYRGRDFYDQGFDGNVDLIIFSRADENGRFRVVELTPEVPEFLQHLPLYEEARRKATYGLQEEK